MADEIEVLPKSRIISVKAEFTFALPVASTREEIEAWVKFELGIESSLENGNPLINDGLDVLKGETYLTDTRLHLHERVEATGKGSYLTRRTAQENPYEGPSAIEQVMELSRKNQQGNKE